MKQTVVGGTKRKVTNALAMAGLIIIFIAYMFPFLMVVINSLKQKRDIIKSPFSWLYTIKGLSFDNFTKAFTQMDFLNAFKNSLIVTVSATVLVTLLAAMLAYYIVRHNNGISKLTFALMVASMIIPFQAIMIPLVSIYGGTLNVLNHRLTLIFMHTGFSMAYVPWLYQGKCTHCSGGGGLHRWVYPFPDIFQNCASAFKAYHLDDGDPEFSGILE